MQEADEQDTCRICSAPEEPDQPLFHPCKCSGTIRYIHQDCLTTWLAHSKKKNCDVCKHPYSFTKVYAPDMPSTLPPVLLIRRLAQQTFFASIFGFRAVAVAIIWLAFLPWVTVWTWRIYFLMGDSTAWWISDQTRPLPEEGPVTSSALDSSLPTTDNFVGRVTAHPLWLSLSADIFAGQIIASLIVLTFVVVFLLREWISQNARPGVFEDEEGLPPEIFAIPPQPEVQQPLALNQQQQVLNFPEQELLLQRQVDTLRALEEMRARNGVNGHMVGEDRHPHGRVPFERQKQKQKIRVESEMNQPVRRRRRLYSDLSDEEKLSNTLRSLKHRQRLHTAQARRRVVAALEAATPSPSSPFPLPEGSSQQGRFEFTFKAPRSLSDENLVGRRSASEPRKFMRSTSDMSRSDVVNRSSDSFSSIFPPVRPNPTINKIPFSFGTIPANNGEELIKSNVVRRPPLPTSGPPISGSSFGGSPAVSPSESSHLVTYRAPEDLETEAGPSSISQFSDRDENEKRINLLELDTNEDGDEEDNDQAGASESDDESINSHKGQDIEAELRKYFIEDVGNHEDGSPQLVLLSDSDDTDSTGVEDEANEGDGGNHERDHEADLEAFDDADGEEEEEEEEDADDADGGFVFEEDENWEAEEPEDDGQRAGGDGDGVQPALGNNQGQPVNNDAAPVADPNEEGEGNVEDDMEGAMEAIGLRGPIQGVFQNAALMIFVLDTAIGFGIWIPFTLGKSFALLSLHPHRFFEILHLPIRGMRVVTDPIVDTVAFLVLEFLFPSMFRTIQKLWLLVLFCVGTLFGSGAAENIVKFASKTYSVTVNLTKPLTSFTVDNTSVEHKVEEVLGTTNGSTSILSMLPDVFGASEPYFAALGKEVRLSCDNLRTSWVRMSLGHGPSEKAFAIALGYALIGIALALYLNVLTVGNARTAGRAVRSAVRQQLLVIKVAAFIFIELVTFPFGCGIVLDLCTVWLFPEANLQSRAAFFVQAPLTAIFYHWVAGTMFMYSFAVLLSGCRSVMRPGAMWFIKDPQDQNAHPIRDILDRPTLTQLRKICVSGLMYSFVVICVVGSVAGLLVLGSKSIMPFRWRNREPLSNVPVDLLFLHLVLPYTMHYFRPKRVVKRFATTVWRFLAKQLRLTSYFFGERHSVEEYTSKWRLSHFFRRSEAVNIETIPDGTFRRVPAIDHVALPRDMRATVAVTENGDPVDDAAKELMESQNEEAVKAKHNIQDDYMVVYLPPHFRYRVIYFITMLWIIGAICLGVAVALPIQLGRSFFGLFTSRQVHDGYSLIIGFYLLWACYLIGRAIDRLDKRRQRSNGDRPRADLRVLVLKRGFLWLAKISYMVVCLGIIIPILVAFVVDLYIVLPIRFAIDPSMTPRIRVVDAWALGLIYAKIALHINRIQPQGDFSQGLQHITSNGWTRPDPIVATKEVIGPLIGGLLGTIILPGAVLRITQYLIPTIAVDDKFIFMHVYPGIFMFVGLIRSAMVLYDILSSWSQAVRDKEFLVEMRLRNHEPENKRLKSNASAPGPSVDSDH